MSPGPAAALLAALGVAALLAGRTSAVALIVAILLAVCLRAGRRARPYLIGIGVTSPRIRAAVEAAGDLGGDDVDEPG